MHPNLSIIVALANENAIGYQNRLLCHIPGDLKRFRDLTLWHPVIMGRKTWESLPKKPLPGRTNIVLTSQTNFTAEGAEVVHNPQQALAKCPLNTECFVIGGAEIYRIFLPWVSKLYITRIYQKFEADTFFPDINFDEWELVAEENYPEDETNPIPYAYLTYVRKSPVTR
ncbi:MAG: dihydrofolate reductase [Bacteroidales bacterium]